MFQERAQRLIFLHGAGEFAQVLQPPRAFGGPLGLEHGGVAALVQYLPGEFGMGKLRGAVPPAGEVAAEGAPAEAGLRRSGERRVGNEGVSRVEYRGWAYV